MEHSSFFNSVGGDRRYRAEDWARYFGSLIGNGYLSGDSTSLRVIPGDGMNVVVRAGMAFINGYFYWLDSDLTLNLSTADGVLKRVDRIVIRLDHAQRSIYAAVKSSDYSSAPTAPLLRRDDDAWELALADVLIGVGMTTVVAANVIDQRMDSTLCGPVVGLIKQLDTTAFTEQVRQLIEQLEEDIQGVKDGSAYVMKSGDSMTGRLSLGVPLGIESGGHGGNTAEQARANLDVPSRQEVEDRMIYTDVDPGAGTAVEYPNGTRIDVYE